ncbi:hypothetical protein EV702DRAFT_1133185 [Suillus placidus]|uniref:Secreted protein n=1 Tax=Suillus placidus TaxID=48579 RepID=A0A9P6ZN27_9AGAM|nr:hypothetical protein EV702DRAFT_1133185 [Suillus placidus]
MALESGSRLAFSALVCLRLLLVILPLPGQNLLKHDHQLSSLLTSYLSCMCQNTANQVSGFLDNNIDPYVGGAFRHVRHSSRPNVMG